MEGERVTRKEGTQLGILKAQLLLNAPLSLHSKKLMIFQSWDPEQVPQKQASFQHGGVRAEAGQPLASRHAEQ